MTVVNHDARNQYVATNGQTIFNYTFEITDQDNLKVYQRSASSTPDDAADLLTITTDYTVTGVNGENGGTIVLVSGAVTGDIITIQGDAPAVRDTSFTPGGVIQAQNLNLEFDNDVLIYQTLLAVLNNLVPKYPRSAIVDDFDLNLPLLGPGESWVMNASGNEIIAAVAGGSAADILAELASHDPGEGASLIGLNPSGTVQDLANAKFILQVASATAPNAQALGALATGILKSTTTTGVLSISAAISSIDALTTVADQMLYTTGANTYATTTLTSYMRTLLDDANAAAAAVTLAVLPLLGGTMLGAINMGGFKITNMDDPTSNQDAATKIYVDTFLSGSFLPLAGGTMFGEINMGSNKITDLLDPTNPQDAATLAYVSSQLGDYLPLSGGTMALNTGVINMNSSKITNLEDPTNAQDAASKAYVDLVAVGLAVQPAVRLATTGALTATYNNGASGIGATLTNAGALAALSLDSEATATNDRVLIKDQADPIENGIYDVTNIGSGAVAWVLTRATDYDQTSEISPGDLIIVNEGTVNNTTSWIETQSVAAIGTDPILFSQFTFAPSAFLLKVANLGDVASPGDAFDNISPLTTKGDLIGYSTTNDRLPAGLTDGQILQVNAAASLGLAYSTAAYPTTATSTGSFIYANGTDFVESTSLWPNTVGSVGKIIRSDGTSNAYTTSTFADTYAVSTILYASSANVVSGLATANSGVLVTSAGGVPSISSTLPAFTTSSITFNPTTGGIVGTTTNDNVAAGKVGEYVESIIAAASAITLNTTATNYDVTSISLTAGDWNLWGNAAFNTGTSGTSVIAWISTTSASLPDTSLRAQLTGTFGSGANLGINVPFKRLSLSATTTVYLSVRANFTGTDPTACGGIFARRVR